MANYWVVSISRRLPIVIINWDTNTLSFMEENTDNYFDITRFQDLLEKLEASKKRQQRQKSVEGRRDIFAGGLANMMSNF